MAPIRVGFVGLSANSRSSWGEQAHLPYLISERGSKKYVIAALLNSSKEAAEKARVHFKLPDSVKTYGKPEDLAADPDIDLVVVSTRTDKHYGPVEPSVVAGKAVFVEWPLAQNLEKATDLLEKSKKSGSASIVDLQGHVAPAVHKVQSLLKEGTIGRVLSSSTQFTGALPNIGPGELYEMMNYFTEFEVGGNFVTIAFVHFFHAVQAVLGEYKSYNAQVHLQRPELKIVESDGSLKRKVSSNVPDILDVHGALDGKVDYVQPGALLSAHFTNTQRYFGDPHLVWHLHGEKGEIKLTSQTAGYIHAYEVPVTIEVYNFETKETEKVDWDYPEWQKSLPFPARNVAEMYERFAESWGKGKPESGREYPDFEAAVRRHELLDQAFKQWKASE